VIVHKNELQPLINFSLEMCGTTGSFE
jgi:hypothetical protein